MRFELRLLFSLLFTVSLALLAGEASANYTISAYTWPVSITQGDTVGVYTSTDAPIQGIVVYRRGYTYPVMAHFDSLPGVLQSTPSNAYQVGCGWHVTKRIPTALTWQSGVYYVYCYTPDGTSTFAIFTLKSKNPGSGARILFQNSISTYEAYNAWGGKSLYDYNSSDGHRSYIVSFQRPYDLFNGLGDFASWEYKMVWWLEQNGYNIDYCTDIDTHADSTLQSHYDLMLIVGHDEYWSFQQRHNIESRIASGKNVIFFAGNTCWWQIRVTPDHKQIICYKDKNLDPLYGLDDSLVTVNWYDDPLFRPENSFTGVSYRNGGYVNTMGYYMKADGYGGYWVERPNDWTFAGSGFADSSIFGYDDSIVGYETDGALYNWVNGLPVVTGTDGTPLNYNITAMSAASLGSATMGYYVAPSGALVYNVATTSWSSGLWGYDPTVMALTNNLMAMGLQRTSVAAPSPGAAQAGSESAADISLSVAPNPTSGPARIRWARSRSSAPQLNIYTVDGRLESRLLATPRPDGGGEAVWNGRDLEGRDAPAGIYFAVFQDGSTRVSRKVLIAR